MNTTVYTSPAESTEKFALLVNLGIITVPDDYVHEKRLTTFCAQNLKRFYYYNDEINDVNFPNPTRVLSPGDKLRVRAFSQVVGSMVTSEECMAFLATQNAIYTGAQGASLVIDQKHEELPKGNWYASFDKPDRLLVDAKGGRWVPYILRSSEGRLGFNLGRLEIVWGGYGALLCFCDVE